MFYSSVPTFLDMWSVWVISRSLVWPWKSWLLPILQCCGTVFRGLNPRPGPTDLLLILSIPHENKLLGLPQTKVLAKPGLLREPRARRLSWEMNHCNKMINEGWRESMQRGETWCTHTHKHIYMYTHNHTHTHIDVYTHITCTNIHTLLSSHMSCDPFHKNWNMQLQLITANKACLIYGGCHVGSPWCHSLWKANIYSST